MWLPCNCVKESCTILETTRKKEGHDETGWQTRSDEEPAGRESEQGLPVKRKHLLVSRGHRFFSQLLNAIYNRSASLVPFACFCRARWPCLRLSSLPLLFIGVCFCCSTGATVSELDMQMEHRNQRKRNTYAARPIVASCESPQAGHTGSFPAFWRGSCLENSSFASAVVIRAMQLDVCSSRKDAAAGSVVNESRQDSKASASQEPNLSHISRHHPEKAFSDNVFTRSLLLPMPRRPKRKLSVNVFERERCSMLQSA